MEGSEEDGSRDTSEVMRCLIVPSENPVGKPVDRRNVVGPWAAYRGAALDRRPPRIAVVHSLHLHMGPLQEYERSLGACRAAQVQEQLQRATTIAISIA